MPTVRPDLRVRFLGTTCAVLAAVAATLVAPPTPAGAVAAPATPTGLPRAIELPAAYVGVASCDPRAKPGVTALGKRLVATYPGTSYGIDRTCGTNPTSEHNEGRAIDWMVSVRKPTQRTQANAVLNWLLAKDKAGYLYANARRLGIMYIIWNNHMWRAYAPSQGWRPYNGCTTRLARSADTTCHRDHIHLSFSWEGAMARTSFWTKRVAARDYGPCRPRDLNWAPLYTSPNRTRCTSYPRVAAPAGASTLLRSLTAYSGQVLRTGSSGSAVKVVQQAVRATVDGRYATNTARAVATWQRAHSLTGSGVVDAATWRALLRVYRPATPVVKPVSPLRPYKALVLRYNSRGPAVVALQKALRVTPASGWFGPKTRTVVIDFQRRQRLPATGVVEARTWKALGA